jgi:hypothetical protein
MNRNILRLGEPELVRGPDAGSAKRQNQYEIRTTPIRASTRTTTRCPCCTPAVGARRLRGPKVIETVRSVRDIQAIDSALRIVASLRRAARERGGPLPSIAARRMRCWMSASEDRGGLRPSPRGARGPTVNLT